MPHWVTFDQETSTALRSQLPNQTIFQRPGNNMMEYLLEDREAIVAVLPSSRHNQVAVAVFRWNRIPDPPEGPVIPAGKRAGGFLGLIDESLFDDEAQKKKSWWQRLWE
ncbi:MAG: hypothetical protein DMG65_20655 [Candidatus Angelobacter sp. Gp1-AA117]|nr:MAG: hypothetical protein DMG65_20655 [Candidatus Angelobacter sp. Gp1-AA117]